VTARDVIAQALALSEAATDGPWRVWVSASDSARDSAVETAWTYGSDGDTNLITDYMTAPDAAFTAAARTLLPALAKALGDVLDQHQQTTAYGVPVCDMCAQVKDADEWDDPSDDYSPVASWLPFPCPTVTAITAALSEVTP